VGHHLLAHLPVTLDISPKPNQPPVAAFTYHPSNPKVGETVTFDASESYDPDGTIRGYEWDLGDGATDSGQIVTHVYHSAGTYTVTLKVIDDHEVSSSTDQTVRVEAPSYDVCPSGCRYSSIAQAITEARPGTPITVGPGTYEENLQITKSLTLKARVGSRPSSKAKRKTNRYSRSTSPEEKRSTFRISL